MDIGVQTFLAGIQHPYLKRTHDLLWISKRQNVKWVATIENLPKRCLKMAARGRLKYGSQPLAVIVPCFNVLWITGASMSSLPRAWAFAWRESTYQPNIFITVVVPCNAVYMNLMIMCEVCALYTLKMGPSICVSCLTECFANEMWSSATRAKISVLAVQCTQLDSGQRSAQSKQNYEDRPGRPNLKELHNDQNLIGMN